MKLEIILSVITTIAAFTPAYGQNFTTGQSLNNNTLQAQAEEKTCAEVTPDAFFEMACLQEEAEGGVNPYKVNNSQEAITMREA